DAGGHRWIDALVLLALYRADHFLLFLLRVDYFQSQRSGRQHAQVRRVRPRYPARQEHRRVYEQDSDQDHGGRRPLSGDSVAAAADYDLGNQAAAAAWNRQLD